MNRDERTRSCCARAAAPSTAGRAQTGVGVEVSLHQTHRMEPGAPKGSRNMRELLRNQQSNSEWTAQRNSDETRSFAKAFL